MSRAFPILLSLAALSACTQPPAQVQVLGGNDYGRAGGGYHTSGGYYNGQSDTANNPNGSAPVYYGGSPDAQNNNAVPQTTQQVAPAGSVMVSDLSAPTQTSSPAQAGTATPPTTHTLQPPTSNQYTPSVQESNMNPWTQKPRDTAAPATTNTTTATTTVAPADSGSKPFIWPVESHNVTSSFGPKSTGKANDGITIASAEGEPVWAAADGEVVYSDNSLKGYGNMVLVKHKGGRTTTYANLSRRAVEKYDRVKQGDIIGYVGSTGGAKSSQLYFAVRQGADAVDPQTLTHAP